MTTESRRLTFAAVLAMAFVAGCTHMDSGRRNSADTYPTGTSMGYGDSTRTASYADQRYRSDSDSTSARTMDPTISDDSSRTPSRFDKLTQRYVLGHSMRTPPTISLDSSRTPSAPDTSNLVYGNRDMMSGTTSSYDDDYRSSGYHQKHRSAVSGSTSSYDDDTGSAMSGSTTSYDDEHRMYKKDKKNKKKKMTGTPATNTGEEAPATAPNPDMPNTTAPSTGTGNGQ